MDIVVVRAMADKRKLQGKTDLVATTQHGTENPRDCCCLQVQTMIWSMSYITTGEIDRCLKKVAEGVEQFEDIWQKVMWFWFVFKIATKSDLII